jgi:predicted anti-sigma-YlaC factor YlaD
MNTGLDRHFPYQVWEDYALGGLSESDCVPVEEHLLGCPACQDLLAEAEEYIETAKTALTLMTHPGEGQPPVTDKRTRRRLSKMAASAASLT